MDKQLCNCGIGDEIEIQCHSAWCSVRHPDATKPSALSEQVGGDHYLRLGDYQPWKVLHATMSPDEFRGYMIGTAQAYLIRNKDNRRQDIEKAMHTLQGWLELTEGE